MIDRRTFLAAGAATLAWPFTRALAAHHESGSGPADFAAKHAQLLEQSGFVYVSPLLADGSESTCHGEVWYGWLDGAVVVITGARTWKGRALARGLDRARVWVGDHGRWKRVLGRNEDFRRAPHFDALATSVRDDALLDRLLALYERKYPEEIGSWRDRMRSGYRDGTRLLIRYEPART
jgi:hypothetical protein